MQSSHLHQFTLEQQSSSFKPSNNERVAQQRAVVAKKTFNSDEDDERAWEQEAVGFGPLWGFYDMWI